MLTRRRTPEPPPDPPPPPLKPGGKGRPTPKRSEAQRRRPVAGRPPATRREAMRLQRQERRERATEVRAGLKRGDDRYLTGRDAGPVRALVRDVVDSRLNAGTLFLPSALVVLVAGVIPNRQVAVFANLLWLGVLVLLVTDSTVLGRLVVRRVRERFPDSGERTRALVFYAVSRSAVTRRFRVPKPRVRRGDAI